MYLGGRPRQKGRLLLSSHIATVEVRGVEQFGSSSGS